MQSKRSNLFVFTCVGIGTAIALLNSSLITTILPNIRQALNLTTSQSNWLVLIFLLVMTVFLIPLGRLSDILGQRLILLTGYIFFTGAEIICGFSLNFLSILVGRTLLGFGSAMILAVGPAILTTTFPRDQRGKVLGIQALISYLGLSLGPLIGGSITHLWGWRFAFFVVIPFALIGLILCIVAVPQKSITRKPSIDRKGMMLFPILMTSVTLLLNSSAISHLHIVIPLLLLLFLIAFWQFIRVERKSASPMIKLSLFRIRDFRFGLTGATLNYFCFYLILFIIPYYLNKILHSSSLEAGLLLTITPLVMTIFSPIVGTLSDHVGSRPFSMAGMCFSTISLALFAIMALTADLPAFILLILGLICAGLGIGIFAAPNNSAIMGAVSYTHQGVASGMVATFRNIGMVLGTTVGGTFFDLIYKQIAQRGTASSTAFLFAFSIIMFIAILGGIFGIVSTFHMSKKHKSLL